MAGRYLVENDWIDCVLFSVAYLLGKASYIPECRRLILQRLPNSNLAHSLESKPYDLISDMY